MESWIEFGRGPLFRLSFVLMILGLARIFLTSFIFGMRHSMGMEADLPNFTLKPGYAGNLGITPGPLWRRPVEAFIETVFHVVVIIVPLFVAAHVVQWHKGVGFAWFQLPQNWADRLTLIAIILALILAAIRVCCRSDLGRAKAFMRPLFVAVPFITGYICVNGIVSPQGYYSSMLIHVWSGNLLMLAIGFTSLADVAISPAVEFFQRSGSRFGRFAEPKWRAFIGRSE